MSIIDDDLVSNTSANETFESVVATRVSRRSLLRGGTATAGAAVALSGTDVLARAVPVHADGRRHHGYGKGYGPTGRRAVARLHGHPGVQRRHGGRPRRLSRRRVDRLGRPGVGRPRVQAGREQHRRRNRPSSGGCTTTASCTSRSTVRRSTASSSRTTSTPTTVCCSPTASPTGTPRRPPSRRTPTASASSRSGAGAAHGKSYGRRGTHAGSPRRRRSRSAVRRRDTICSRRARPRRHDSARHGQQLRDGLHAVGHVSRLRGELQRVLQGSAAPATGTPLQRYGIGPSPHDTHGGRPTRGSTSTPAQRIEPLRLGGRDQPVEPEQHTRQAHRAGTPQARGRVGAGGPRRARRRVHGRRPGVRVHLPLRVEPAVAEEPPTRHQPARRRSALRGALRRQRHRYLAAADTRQPGTCRLVDRGDPDQHAGRRRHRRRDEDGPAGVDRHVSRRVDGGRHADEQHQPRASACATPPVDAANPRANNVYGHIIRWGYDIDFTGPDVLVGLLRPRRRPRQPGDTARRSTATSTGHPTGCTSRRAAGCGSRPTCRHRTINSGAYAGFGNNQMLCADPTTRRTRRFLVGPNECEITGCFATPDETTLFVGIQHPGERAADRAIRGTRRRSARGPTAAGRRSAAARHHQGRRRRDRQLSPIGLSEPVVKVFGFGPGLPGMHRGH